jgi:hypothetical protein
MEVVMTYFFYHRNYYTINLEWQSKTTKISFRVATMGAKELNQEFLEYEERILTTQPWYLTRYCTLYEKELLFLDFVHCLSFLKQHFPEICAILVFRWTGYEGKPILLGSSEGRFEHVTPSSDLRIFKLNRDRL